MSKKRIVALLATLTLAVGLFAGCKPVEEKKPETTPAPAASETKKEETKAPEKKFKIGLSTDEGGLNDKSFNQAADTGVKKAVTEFGLEYKPIESKTKDDYESNLEALLSDKSDLVFAIGFQMEQAVKNVAGKFADKKFAIIDSVVDLPNVNSYVFKEEEGSFLMGVIAGKMTKTGKVGFIGGKDFDLINKFEAGFAAGVKAVNPKAAEDLINRKNVKYADSFGDTNKGNVLAKDLLNSGVDVIYHAAGGVGEGMFQAIKEAKDGGKEVWGIGVDMDQAVTLPQYAKYILSSMIKRVDTATYQASKAIAKGTFKGKEVVVLGLKEEGVGIAPSSNANTPKEVLDLVAKYQDAVKAGTIKVPTKHTDVANFTVPEIK